MRISICNAQDWTLPDEMQQTNYLRHLYYSYSQNRSKNDCIFIKKGTGRLHINVDRYDEDGRRRSLLEITIIVAIKIIQYFWERHFKKAEYPRHTTNKEHCVDA